MSTDRSVRIRTLKKAPAEEPKKRRFGNVELIARTRPKSGVLAARGTSKVAIRRRRRRVIIGSSIALIVAALVYGISWVSYLPPFLIQSVVVTGNEHVRTQTLVAFVETQLDTGSNSYFANRNIFFYPKAGIEQSLIARVPRIRAAQVALAPLSNRALSVSIEERTPVDTWCADPADSTTCYQLDRDGFIFAHAATTTGFVFSGGVASSSSPIGSYFLKDNLKAARALLIALVASGLQPAACAAEDDEFDVRLQSGAEVKALMTTPADDLTQNLKAVLGSDVLRDKVADIEYVDLRFGNKVFYKLQSATSTKK